MCNLFVLRYTPFFRFPVAFSCRIFGSIDTSWFGKMLMFNFCLSPWSSRSGIALFLMLLKLVFVRIPVTRSFAVLLVLLLHFFVLLVACTSEYWISNCSILNANILFLFHGILKYWFCCSDAVVCLQKNFITIAYNISH